MQDLIELVSVLARLAVGSVLLLAGVGKLRSDKSVFLQAILAFEVIPPWAAGPVARSLPCIEIVLGLMLVVGVASHAAALTSFVLIAVLTVVVIHALAQGKRVFCSCFGFTAAQVARVQRMTTLRNLVLLLACIDVATAHDRWMLDRRWTGAVVDLPGVASACMVFAWTVIAAMVLAVRLGWTYAPAAAPTRPLVAATTTISHQRTP